MLSNEKSGCKELLMQKMFLAIASSIGVQFFLLSCLIFVTNLSQDHTTWIQHTWNTITSLRMWSYFFILASVTFMQGIVWSKSYLNSPSYIRNRFSILRSIFTSQNLLLCTLYVTIGGILVWLHLSLDGGQYSSLIENCYTMHDYCLVEEHYFLLLSGLWNGLYFFMKTSSYTRRCLKFPIVPQSKFVQLKRGILEMIPSLTISCIWPSLYYMISYYFLGSYLRSILLSILPVQLESKPLDSIPRLIDLTLMLHLWLYNLSFVLITNSMYLLFEVYLTEWITFEFGQTSVFNNDNTGITLVEALSMDKMPIMQHLGYLDLITLAQKDKSRRSVLFTLSQPGGHPYNWNCVVEKCLSLIRTFSADLSEALTKKEERMSSTFTNNQTFRTDYNYHMRNLVSPKTPVTTIVTDADIKQSEFFIFKFCRVKWQNFISYLLSKPLIYYIFGEQEDNKTRYVLLSGQPVIWAMDALSCLTVSSLIEDSYGIVQKDLPLIIDVLLSIKISLEKLQKSNVLTKKHYEDKLIKHIFTSLRGASKRSLYRIITGFEPYIMDLSLEPTVMEQLQGFLHYKE